jgi:hypothetical protein
MNISKHASGEAQKNRNCCQFRSQMSLNNNSLKSSQLVALWPRKGSHHV